MLSTRNLLTILRFLVLVSVAILACVELAIVESTPSSSLDANNQHHLKALTTVASPNTMSLEERGKSAGREPLAGWVVRLFTKLWKKPARTRLIRGVSPRFHLNPANEPKTIATAFFRSCQVDAVTEHLFESGPFAQWSRLIKQEFNHKNFDEDAKIMVDVLVDHDEDMLFKSIAEAKKTTGLTATVKGLESALLNKCIDNMGTDKKLLNLYKYPLIQKWYQSSRESAVVQLQTKVDAAPGLHKQVDRTVVEAETLAGEVQIIAKDVKAISEAELVLAVEVGASDTEIVTSARLDKWLAVVHHKGFNAMEVLTARLKASSHEDIFALCESELIPQNVRRGLQNAVFAKLKGQAVDRVTALLNQADSRYKEDLRKQWFVYLQEQHPGTSKVEMLNLEYVIPQEWMNS